VDRRVGHIADVAQRAARCLKRAFATRREAMLLQHRHGCAPLGSEEGFGPQEWPIASPTKIRAVAAVAAGYSPTPSGPAWLPERAVGVAGIAGVKGQRKVHMGSTRDVELPDEVLLEGLSPKTPATRTLVSLSPAAAALFAVGLSPKTPAGSPPTPLGTPSAAHVAATLLRTPKAKVADGRGAAACALEPTADEIRRYGSSVLGVDIEAEPTLAWVVEEAFAAELPSGWSEHKDTEGRAYFFNEALDESVWEHPMDVVYRDLLDLVRRIRMDVPEKTADCRAQRVDRITQRLQEVHQLATTSLEDWSGPYTSEYGEYFFNARLEVSSWVSPIDSWEHALATCERVLCQCLLADHRGRALAHHRLRLRAVVWTLFVFHGLLRCRSPRRSYELDAAVDAGVIRSIDCDIPRTAGGDPELSGSLGVTRALLLRHAAEDAELGYCQGMNLVASVFAVATRSQAEAYERFRHYTSELRGLWLPGFPQLLVGMAQFESLAESRPWFQHLCRHRVQPDMYLPRAWMGLFAKWLPLPTRVLFLPHLEGKGIAGLLAVSLAILDLQLPWILEQADMDDVLACLENMRSRAPDVAVLLVATEAWLPIVSAAISSRSRSSRIAAAASSRVLLLRRQGSRVLDSSGREALYVGVSKRLSTLWAERTPKLSRATCP